MPRARHAKRFRSRSAKRRSKRARTTRRTLRRKNMLKAPRFVSFAPIVQEKVKTWLTYYDTKTIAPDTGAAKHVFNLANIYDPDVTGGGHQPAFYDQWKTYYNKYRVLGARYWIKFRRGMYDTDITDQAQNVTTGTGTYPVVLKQDWRDRHILFTEVNPTNSFQFTASTDLNFLRETGKKMSGVDWKYGPAEKGTVMKGYIRFKDVMYAPEYGDTPTTFGASPTDAVFLAVGAMSKSGDQTNSVGFDIKIDFLVELTDVKDMNESNTI